MKTCQQTCTRTVVNYVPQTAYRTAWKPVPVTSYKPVTNTDPCTGCTVTCMRPCTTYTYQCQRVPYTTYRPVYRQETYKVPVTTITNDCATGTCNTGCATCPTAPQQSFAPTPAATTSNFAPQTYAGAPSTTTSTYYETPEGTIVPQGSSSPTPANIAPSLDGSSTRNLVNPQSLQKPFLERYQSSYSKVSDRSHIPARINIEDRTAQSPVRKNWSYSPVRLAGYEKPMTTRASYSPIQRAPRNESRNQALNGWTEVK